MKQIRVMVVDDSSVVRRIIRESLDALPDIQVIATAADPFEAREKIKELNPDVLTLDIDMPGMDGLAFLEKIMQLRPMPVVMVSRLTQDGAATTLRALELGAIDCIGKPFANKLRDVREDFTAELADKIRVAARSTPRRLGSEVLPFPPQASSATSTKIKLVVMGASTGGVETLCPIFSQLPKTMPPILLTQHMPAAFTPSFAARLDSISAMHVSEAEDGMPILPGRAYVAPGGRHLLVVNKGAQLTCLVTDGEKVSGHKPSVDLLFRSAAEAVGKEAMGVLLTGMGRDGAAGLLAMRQHGAITIGQDEASCVVYGMPKEAASLGALTHQLSPQAIADMLITHARIAPARMALPQNG